MKYFTIEMYEEMQVRGNLVYYESKEDLEQSRNWYINEGRDFYGESLHRFEMISPCMLKYLPKNLLKYVHDKSIMDCYLLEPAMKEEVAAWKTQWDLKWKRISEEYKQHYDSIYPRLMGGGRKLGKEFRIHDARILDVTSKENRAEIAITTVENKDYNLMFSGVETFEYKDSFINNICLYMEIELIDRAVFEIQILLDDGTRE